MTTIQFGQLIDQAAEAGFSNEVLPDGPCQVEVTTVRASVSQKGNPQIGVRLKVIAGPLAGKSAWDNINIHPNPDAEVDPEKKTKAIQSNGFSFIRLNAYGVSADAIKTAATVEAIAAMIAVGRQYNAELGHRDFGGKTYQNVKKVVALQNAVAAAPAVAAPVAAVAPVAVAAAPAPATPQDIVIPAVLAPVAPAVVAPPAVAF